MRDKEVTITSQIRITLVLLGVIAAAMLIGMSLIASSRLDYAFTSRQQEYVAHGLQDAIDDVPRVQQTVTIWDDHVAYARLEDRRWLEENVGEWMFTYHGHDRVYILDNKNTLIYAMRDGRTVSPAGFEDDETAIAEAVDIVRTRIVGLPSSGEGSRKDVFEVAVIALQGKPAVLGIRPILPQSNRMGVAVGQEYLYVSIRLLNRAMIEDIAHHFMVKGMEFNSVEPNDPALASVPVPDGAGNVLGYLTWRADRPGVALLQEVAPAAIFAFVVVGGIAVFLGRRLRFASLALHAREQKARHLAFHDTLTGLPNRTFFQQRLDAALRSIDLQPTALFFIDLDRFKCVNDTLGHQAGDELVRQAGRRLGTVVRKQGIVARIGGDEFGVVVDLNEGAEQAAALAEQLLEALRKPFLIDGETVHIGGSIGIALAPEGAREREELLRNADVALYEAKKRGRGCYQFFSDAMGDVLKQRRVVEADLRLALERGDELRLHYQPLYSDRGEMIGAEALLRWDHPVHKNMSPLFIISIAEETGMIMPLGDWILREACHMAARTDLPWISVNVSAVQLRDENFAERCLAIIDKAGLSPERIQLEVTETVLIENPVLTKMTFEILRVKGVHIAIDDFGTGYSSMSYLQNYPVDRLKIDRSFVRALSDSKEGQAIVSAMMQMARALKLGVVAEGVETTDQRELLSAMGCTEMQGYLFSRPLSEQQFVRALEQRLALSA